MVFASVHILPDKEDDVKCPKDVLFRKIKVYPQTGGQNIYIYPLLVKVGGERT